MTWLESDIRGLGALFLRLTGRQACRVRLELVTRDACRRFHHDYVSLRMLCTYAGPGTQWVPREHVTLNALDQVDGDVEEQNRRIVPDPSHVMRAEPMDVLVLKGATFQGEGSPGAVHRSPPIETLGTPRLLLTIDAVTG